MKDHGLQHEQPQRLKAPPAAPISKCWLPIAVTLAFGLLAAVPWQPQFADASIDASWGVGVRLAFLDGISFGRDFVIVLGPLGWVFLNTYHPGGYAALVGFWGFMAVAISFGMWMQLRAQGCSPWLAAIVTMGLVCCVAVRPDSLLYAVSAVLLARWFGDEWNWRADGWMLAVAAGLIPLVKFSHLLAASLVVGLVSIDEIRRKRTARVAAVSGAVFAWGWRLCGQPLSGLPDYLRTSLELTLGYGEAMAHDACPVGLIVGFAAVAGLIVFRLAWHGGRRREVSRILFAAGVAGIAILVFKATFVRCDQPHLPIGGAMLPLLACLCQPSPRDGSQTAAGYSVGWSLAAIALVVTLAIRAEAYPDHPERIPPIPGMLVRNPPAILGFITGSRSVEHEAAAVDETVRARHPFSGIQGAVDMVGYEQTALVAHGLDFQPRPVMHGNCAYTRRLAEMNVARLQGPSAPRHILLTMESIDDRLPWLDDSLVRLEVLRHYEPLEMRGRHLLLRRREQQRTVCLSRLEAREITIPDTSFLPLPEQGPLWATIKLRPTAWCRLWSLVYRPPLVTITFRLMDDTQRTFRLVPHIAESGFLISPLVETEAQFASLEWQWDSPSQPANRVTGIRIGVNSATPGWFYRDSAEVQVFAVGFDGDKKGLARTDP